MEHRLTKIESTMSKIEGELSAFKTEMSGFKTEMYDFRTEMYDFRTEMRDFKRATALGFDRMNLRFDGLQAAWKEDLGRVIGILESFSSTVEGAKRDREMGSDAYMRQERRLDDHEARLRKLEEPKS